MQRHGSRAVIDVSRRHDCGVLSTALAKPHPFTHYLRESLRRADFFGGFLGGFDLMTIFRIGNFQLGLLLATGLAVSISPAESQAYTPEQEQACTGDAFRLCSSDIPDISRVTACMIRNKSQLSPACRAHFRPDPEEVAARPVGRPTVIRPAAPRKAATAKARMTKKPKKPAN